MRYQWTAVLIVVALVTAEARAQDPTGKCCTYDAESNLSCAVVTEANCNGRFRVGLFCEGVCQDFGGCCRVPFGSEELQCSLNDENSCLGNSGVYRGDVSNCDEVCVAAVEPCDSPAAANKTYICHFAGEAEGAKVIEVAVRAEQTHLNNHFDCVAEVGLCVGDSCSCSGETLSGDLQIICNFEGIVEVLSDIDMLFDDECSADLSALDVGDFCSCL